MLISVVIPTHARPEGLKDLLRSLADQDFARGEFEIHVVSNFEEDPSAGVVDRFHGMFQNLYWHYAGEKGANRARNVGLEHARGEIALLLDDDCVVPHRYYLRDVLQAHRDHPEMLAIGGGYFAPVDAGAAELAYNHIADVWLKRRAEDGGKCVNLVGGNVSYKRRLMVEREFKFKDDIVFGGAETELHLRMFRAGSGLLYLPELRVEHRARIGGLQLLRKGFKQGMASHARWSIGLHVATRIPEGAVIPTLPALARFWKDTFDRAFAMGSDHVRIKPAPRKRDWAVRLLGRSIYTQIKRALYRWKFGQLERRHLVSLPLQRFFVVPVSDQCRYSCSYCESLGCKKVTGPLEDELKKAKTYGFTEVLLPCNATFTPGLEDMIEKIHAHGLKPSLLVNGDASAQIDLEKAKRLAGSLSFHLLLGQVSNYQKTVLAFLEKRCRDFTATYFHVDRKTGFSILRNLPPALANRVHYLFATKGTAWHPNPSGVEIHKFLTKIRRLARSRYLMHLRGPAGFWPVQRPVDANRPVFPMIGCGWSSGTPSKETEFSVVIPSFDSGASLVKVLQSLRAQSISFDRFEVLVMDDGSSDGTLDMLKKMGESPFHLRHYYWPRPASPDAQTDFRAGLIRNLGVAESRGEYLCFLDSDILIPPDYLSDLERRFESNDVIQARRDMLTQDASRAASDYGSFGPSDVYPDDSYWETFKSLDSWSQTPQFWKYTCTYALSMRKDLFLKAGWFSPEFFSYGFEDVDLGYRLFKLGARFHLSQNTVFHLYPERSELNYHFNEEMRTHALTLSSRVFFRNRLDPEIFNEFYPAYYEPLAGKLWINVMQPALKPYYFTRYQVQKRLLAARARAPEVSHAES